jgi:two-component system response regulator
VPDNQDGAMTGQSVRTVLLVEDNPTDVFVIKEVMRRTGLNVRLHVLTNGEEALRYLDRFTGTVSPDCPSLIILDLNLPRVTGIEILRRLRGSEPSDQTPVIIVTSSTAERDRTAVQKLGADGYFQKPNDLSAYIELGKLVKRVLEPFDTTH